MPNTQDRLCQAWLIGGRVSVQSVSLTERAENTNDTGLASTSVGATDMNAVELIKPLQRRIEELEQKVTVLQRDKATGAGVSALKAQQHIDELDQEANAVAAKEAPKATTGDFRCRLITTTVRLGYWGNTSSLIRSGPGRGRRSWFN